MKVYRKPNAFIIVLAQWQTCKESVTTEIGKGYLIDIHMNAK